METDPSETVRLFKIHLHDLCSRGDDSSGGKPLRHQTFTIRRVPYIQPAVVDCLCCLCHGAPEIVVCRYSMNVLESLSDGKNPSRELKPSCYYGNHRKSFEPKITSDT
jgi:hypothetical protein